MSQLVYICAPYRGDVQKNIENAKKWAKQVYDHGDIPITPHLMFPFVPDNDREVLDRCITLLGRCEVMVICGDEITEGMQLEMDYVSMHNMRITGGRLDEWLNLKKKLNDIWSNE